MRNLIVQKHPEKYESILNNAVDRTLNQIFGYTATEIIYSNLENRYSLRKDEIATNLELFAQAMEDYLNTGGATVIEKEILESFLSDLGLSQPVELQSSDEFVGQIARTIKLEHLC